MKGAMPYYLLAGAAGVVFVVWLFTSMARTEYANRVLLTLVVCFALVALAGMLGMVRRREGDRER